MKTLVIVSFYSLTLTFFVSCIDCLVIGTMATRNEIQPITGGENLDTLVKATMGLRQGTTMMKREISNIN